MHTVAPRPLGSRKVALVIVFATVSLVVFLALAVRAQAETILWNNYGGDPDTIGFAENISGSGGGLLNLGTEVLEGPEGMAYDTVTNRLFVASHSNNKIVAINLDGSGASSFAAPGAVIDDPQGLTLDPVARRVYWINTGSGTIYGANLDGTAGGQIPTGEVDAYRLALDPVGGRLYWFDSATEPGQIHFANVNGSGGGTLNIAGASPTDDASGIAVDPAGGRVYWLNDDNEFISFASLSGAGGGNLPVLTGTFNGPYGLAIDLALGRLYWANYDNSTTSPTNAFGFVNLVGGGGAFSIASAPVKGPQDPIVLKAPAPTGLPAVTRAKSSRSQLTCSAGSWGADYAGSFVYQAPRGFAYQWTLNGKAIAGATTQTLNATKAGGYACTVTATNQTGNTAQTSAITKVGAAKAKLTTKKKVTAKAGGIATFKVKITNQGDLQSKQAKVCVKLPKSAKGALKAPKCKSLGKLKGRGKKSATLKIKVLPAAAGTYRVTFKVKGSAGKPVKSKIQILGTD